MWYIHSSVIKERTKKHFYQSSNKTARLKCTCNLSNPYGRNSRLSTHVSKQIESTGGRGVITTSFSVVSWQVDSATWTNFFLCATEKLIVPTLSITGGGYKSDYRNITNVIFPASRAAFAVYQCDIGDSCLLCSSEAEIHRFGKRTKAEQKKKKGIEREKTISKSGTSDLLRSPKHRQEQFHFEMYNVISISPFVPFRRFSSMCTREGVRPVRLSRPPLFELS